jgi:carbon monoxide dehydrogenase subunit G
MANDFEVGIDIAVPPDAAWALAGDPARVHEWFPAVTGCEVVGDERRATTARGGELVERLSDIDPAGRSYAYSVIDGIPGLTSHRATIAVLPSAAGSRVVWRQTATSDVEGYDLERRLSGVMTQGLERLREILEAGGR